MLAAESFFKYIRARTSDEFAKVVVAINQSGEQLMFDAFIEGLFLVLQWKAFSLMMLGMALGFAVGLLPGIGGAATLALMLPFIFKMSPAEAFAFLLGMHAVAATTGDITSVLFGVPGEAISAATVVDGYPMAKRGEAGRAGRGVDEFFARCGDRRRGAGPCDSGGSSAGPYLRLPGTVHAFRDRYFLHHFSKRVGRARAAQGLRHGSFWLAPLDYRPGAAIRLTAI